MALLFEAFATGHGSQNWLVWLPSLLLAGFGVVLFGTAKCPRFSKVVPFWQGPKKGAVGAALAVKKHKKSCRNSFFAHFLIAPPSLDGCQIGSAPNLTVSH